ncbi:amp-binding protein [Stylonychia lemnae]|uniref:Amp-binding protein n=1 Tax=Stylonychia lemnae TaxID=5949 RepID=A0A077ZVP1_STYLE|nr:amp-binding protein [Stylonychia lemnae]|eukprot:CDW74005.1 amp-binding protein [Stylonychia lemnae]
MMYCKHLLRRGFATQVSHKFPENTVAGLYKLAVANNQYYDAVRFGNQRINWTLREMDRYSSAFAFGLLESGYQRGDKLVLWADQTNSAELLLGALKAGVAVVVFDEKDSQDALHYTLNDSDARGILFSPSTEIAHSSNGEHVTRKTFLQKLMPELHNLYPGDEIALKSYPHLKQIIQLGHHTIRGVIKFKDSMVYASPSLSTVQIPDNRADDQAFVSYQNGKRVSSLTNGEITQHAQSLWENHYSQHADSNPVFMSLNLETPLALASFIANNSNLQKVYIPSSFNVNKIIENIKVQGSHTLVCDADLYTLEPPQSRKAEFEGYTQTIKRSVIASNDGNSVGKSSLYKGDTVVLDPYRL